MYNYFYKITNQINNHYYYGVHSTENLNDGYMGSGSRLRLAYKKYGIKNFKKEIIKFFNSADEAYDYEKQIVNDKLIKLEECYNIQCGGKFFNTKGYVACKDCDNNKFLVEKTFNMYLEKKVVPIWTGLHHTSESKNKIRKTMQSKSSSNNPRIWISKNGTTKYILKTKLQDFLQNGWELGRINYKPIKNGQGKILK